MTLYRNLFFFIIFFLNVPVTYCYDRIIVKDPNTIIDIGNVTYLLEDPTNRLTIDEVRQSKNFLPNKEPVLNLGISSSAHWIKFTVKNASPSSELLLEYTYPLTDEIEFYEEENGIYKKTTTGDNFNFSSREYNSYNFIFSLHIPRNQEKTYFLKLRSNELIMLHLQIGGEKVIMEQDLKNEMFSGIYLGILLVMGLYNFFLFITIRDRIYIYYVLYVIAVGFTQATLMGYTFKYLWPQSPDFTNTSLTIFAAFTGIFGLLFSHILLKIEHFIPWMKKIFVIITYFYFIAITLSIIGYQDISFRCIDLAAIAYPLIVLYAAIVITNKNYRPAKFFLVGWSIILTGFIVFALRNLGILPYYNFGNYMMQTGTAVEVVIFSFALADRINILKKENEEKQIAVKEAELILEKLKKESFSLQLESLKNQVNPHFLFNSLNVLTELIQHNKQRATEFVKELSDVYRYILHSKNNEVVNMQTELDFIHSFNSLLKIRYADSLDIHYNIENPTTVMIVPMTLQILVENAIKHNELSSENPLHIQILQETEWIIVKNKIRKKIAEPIRSGIGLKNILQRYEFLTDKKIEIVNDGESFTVKVPVLKFRKYGP